MNIKILEDSDDGLLKQNLLGCLVKLSLHRVAQVRALCSGECRLISYLDHTLE